MTEIRLRPYQEPGVAGVRDAFKRGKKAPVFVMGTGGGKTFCFSFITRGAVAKENRVLILVHRAELVKQTSKSLKAIGVPHGLIAAKRTPDRNQMVQVASVQTLVKRLHDVIPPDLIVVDEGHHAVAGTWKKIVDAFPNARLLLVTATPERLDGKGLGDVADEMVLGPQAGELIADGWLSTPIYYVIPNDADFSKVRNSSNGDLNQKELAAATGKSTIFGDAVENYRRICPYVPAVAFCVNRKHAEEVTEKFREGGFRWAVLDGTMDGDQREKLVEQLADGRLHGVSTVDVVSEGFDLPVVTCAIFLRKTDSLALYLQQGGRTLRPLFADGMPIETVEDRMMAQAKGPKPFAVIIDHVGNVAKHGLIEMSREWSLEGAKARKKREAQGEQVQLRQCPKCYAVHVPAPQCVACGHVYEPKGREIRVVEGELVPLISGKVLDDRFTQCKCGFVHAKGAKECPSCKHSDEPADFDGGKMLAALIAIGKKKGMKNPVGWASHVYRAKMAERGKFSASNTKQKQTV